MSYIRYKFSSDWKEIPAIVKVPSWYIEKLKSLEGFRGTAYKPKGESNLVAKLTIGYGHYGAEHGDTISEDDAHDLLLKDLERVENELLTLLPATKGLSLDRWCCYVDFLFNVGASKFKQSTLYKVALSDVNSYRIPLEFSRWVFSGSTRLKGLVNRRKYFFDVWKRNSNEQKPI